MRVDEYIWDYTEKFVGFHAEWTLGNATNHTDYYTKHTSGDIYGWNYYFDVPDDIDTEVSVNITGYYVEYSGYDNTYKETKVKWTGSVSFSVSPQVYKRECFDDSGSHLNVSIMMRGLSRVNTVAVYNESVWREGRYLYKGNFYIIYVNNTGAPWYTGKGIDKHELIVEGTNVIVVPYELFVNSKLYSEIESGNISYLVGNDSGYGKMGAITRSSNEVHIVGMFFMQVDVGSAVKDLLDLLSTNESGMHFANYSVIEPEGGNLPGDVLEAIPYEAVENGPEGEGPSSTSIEVLGFIHQGLVAIGNFILHAGEIVAEFYLWPIVILEHPDEVAKALEEMRQTVDSLLDAIEREIRSTIKEILSPLMEAIEEWRSHLTEAVEEIYEKSQGNASKIEVEELREINILLMPLWEIGIGIGTAVMALSMFLIGVTFGSGALLGALISYMAYMVATTIMGSTQLEKCPLPISESLDIQGIMALMKDILHIGDNNNSNNGNSNNNDSIAPWAWGAFSALAGWGSFIFGMASYFLATGDGTGTLAGILAIAANIFGFVFAVISAPLTKDYQIDFFGLLGLFFGIEGVVFGLMGLKGANLGAIITGAISIGLGLGAAFLTLKAMGVI